MYIYTKILYVKRTTYIEVFVYYSRKGEKFRPTTGVKVNPKHITKGGDISSAHPHFEHDLGKIGIVQQRVEALIEQYIQQYNEKPSVAWLESAYRINDADSNGLHVSNDAQGSHATGAAQAHDVVSTHSGDTPLPYDDNPEVTAPPVVAPSVQRTISAAVTPAPMAVSLDLMAHTTSLEQDVLCYWDDFMAEKREVVRNENSLKRLSNARYSFLQYCKKRNVWVPFSHLVQRFFNDYVVFMVKEQEYFRNRHQEALGNIKPSIGLNNNTAIKRLSDLVEYLKYCSVVKDVSLNLDKIRHYVEVAKKKNQVYPFRGKKRWELTLSVEEIEFVVNLDHYEPLYWKSLSDNQKRYLDILIFMCLQGTNPKDTRAVSRIDIEQEGLNKDIIRDRSKTFVEFDVPLDPIAEAILERNDYDLSFTEQTLNRELKNMFVTIFELYRPRYEQRTGQPYKIVCRQRSKKGDEDIVNIEHRGRYIECSTGRRSYVSNHTRLAGLQATKERVGHTSEATTIGYAFGEQQALMRKSTFGIKKITIQTVKRKTA